ncbi:MAG: tetratricopeptide repeat protein [Candidatus Omnitrophota bacterium]
MDNQTALLTRSPYEVLKVSRWADEEEIKANYFLLVKQFNPEYFPDEFIEIRTAYDLLKDPATRAKSDIGLFAAPPNYYYSDYPHTSDHPLSLFKLTQELKTICNNQSPHLEDLIRLDGETLEKAHHILRGISLYHTQHNQLPEAVETWKWIRELDPSDEETKRNQAFALWEEGYKAALQNQFADAENSFNSLLEQGVEHGVIYQNLALAYEKQGKKAESENAWHKALDFFNGELKANPNDEYLKAIVICIHKYTGGKFIDGSANSVSGSMSGGSAKELGYACIQKGNWKQAVDALEQALRENEDDVDVLCQMGWAYLNTNQHHKSFHMWNLALKKAPGKRQVIDHLVRGYTIFGKRLKDQRIFNQALVQFKNALKYEPENMDLMNQLAETYFLMRNYSAAMSEYQRILDKDPRNKAARQGMREAKRLGGLR